jgi:hypothetical protein
MLTSSAYIIYIVCSVFITIFVSRTLSKSGEVYLTDGFGGDSVLAASVNHMLVVGFYLLNLGFVLVRMRTDVVIENAEALIVYLSSSVGFILCVLGVAHFFNMYIIHKFRKGHVKAAVGRDVTERVA